MNQMPPKSQVPNPPSAVSGSVARRKNNDRFFPSAEPLSEMAPPRRDQPCPPVSKPNPRNPGGPSAPAGQNFGRADAGFVGNPPQSFTGPPAQSSGVPSPGGAEQPLNLKTMVIEEMLLKRERDTAGMASKTQTADISIGRIIENPIFALSDSNRGRQSGGQAQQAVDKNDFAGGRPQNNNPFSYRSSEDLDVKFPIAKSLEPSKQSGASPSPDFSQDIELLKRMTRENTESLKQLSTQLASMASSNKTVMDAVMALKQEVEALKRQRGREGPAGQPRNGQSEPRDYDPGSETSEYLRLKDEIDYKTRRIAELQEKVNSLSQELAAQNPKSRTEYNMILDEKNRKINELMQTNQQLKEPRREERRSYFREWVQIMKNKEEQLGQYRDQLRRASHDREAKLTTLKGLNEQNNQLRDNPGPSDDRPTISFFEKSPVPPESQRHLSVANAGREERDLLANKALQPSINKIDGGSNQREYFGDAGRRQTRQATVYSQEPIRQVRNSERYYKPYDDYRTMGAVNDPRFENYRTYQRTEVRGPERIEAIPSAYRRSYDVSDPRVTPLITRVEAPPVVYNQPRVSTTSYTQPFSTNTYTTIRRDEIRAPSNYSTSSPYYEGHPRYDDYGRVVETVYIGNPRTYFTSMNTPVSSNTTFTTPTAYNRTLLPQAAPLMSGLTPSASDPATQLYRPLPDPKQHVVRGAELQSYTRGVSAPPKRTIFDGASANKLGSTDQQTANTDTVSPQFSVNEVIPAFNSRSASVETFIRK